MLKTTILLSLKKLRVLTYLRRYYRQRFPGIKAYVWRRVLFRTKFIAVCGSVGKTSAKEMLANVLSINNLVQATPENRNLRRYGGLEESILLVRPWHRFAVIEIATTKPGEMDSAAALLKPEIILFLDVRNVHTDTFKTTEEVFKEKSTIFKHFWGKGVAIVNGDNRYLAEIKLEKPIKKILFGTSPAYAVYLNRSTNLQLAGMNIDMTTPTSTISVKSNLIGECWNQVILGVTATADYCDVSAQDIKAGIEITQPFRSRMQPVQIHKNNAIFLRDEYNASLESLQAAIQTIDNIKNYRKIVVFGDIRGIKKRDRIRARVLGTLAAEHFDSAVFVGIHGEIAVNAAIKAGMKQGEAAAFMTIGEANKYLSTTLAEGDLVYVKGKNQQHLERIFLSQLDDIHCHLDTCALARSCDSCSRLGFDGKAKVQLHTKLKFDN